MGIWCVRERGHAYGAVSCPKPAPKTSQRCYFWHNKLITKYLSWLSHDSHHDSHSPVGRNSDCGPFRGWNRGRIVNLSPTSHRSPFSSPFSLTDPEQNREPVPNVGVSNVVSQNREPVPNVAPNVANVGSPSLAHAGRLRGQLRLELTTRHSLVLPRRPVSPSPTSVSPTSA